MIDIAPSPEPEILSVRSLMAQYTEALEQTASRPSEERGIRTGFSGFDRLVGGHFPPSTLVVLHGEPGAGKTSFAMQWAGQCKAPVVYLTVEQPPLELFTRLVAAIAQKPRRQLLCGAVAPEVELGWVARVCGMTENLHIVDGRSIPATPEWLRSTLLLTREGAAHQMLVIDSLHSWAGPLAPELTEYEALNAAVHQLRAIAAGHEITVLAVAERNRQSMKAGGLSATAGTRRAEYSADFVVDLSVEDQDDKPSPAPGAVEITPVVTRMVKNRSGPKGAATKFSFQGEMFRFHELARA